MGLSPLALLVLSACGGGGISIGGSSLPTGSLFYIRDGKIIKGPLKDAVVFLDYNGDQNLGPDEPFVRTNADGSFSLEGDTKYSDAKVVAITDAATIDTSSGSILADVKLSAPIDANVVSIASTIMMQSNLSEDQVQEALGISKEVDLLTFNPFEVTENATASEKKLARDVEVKSQMATSVLTSMAAAAKASGLSAEDAFQISLNSVSALVVEKAEERVQGDSSAEVDFTDVAQLSNIADQVVEAINEKQIQNRQAVIDKDLDPNIVDNYASAGVSFVTLNGVMGVKTDLVSAVKNVNDALNEIEDDAFTRSETIYSISQALVSQVAEAVTAETNSANSGIDYLKFTNIEIVNTSKYNPAPTDIDFKIDGSIINNEDQIFTGILFSEDDVSPKIAEIYVTDQKADPLGGLTPETNFTYSLAGEDASYFNINNGILFFNTQPNYELKQYYEITITVKDSGEKSFSEKYRIDIQNIDEPVFNISINDQKIIENNPGDVVGDLSATDPENMEISFELTGSADFEKFEITPEGVLKLKDTVAANFETKSSYKVTVRASDGVNVTDKVIEVSVEDVNEAPTLTKPVDLNIIENSGATVLGQFEVNDPEGSEDLKFIVSGSTENGSNLEVIGSYGTLTIDQGTRNYSYSLDDNNVLVDALSTNDTLTEIFQISVSDGTSLSNVQELAVTIAGVNDVPTIEPGLAKITENELGDAVTTFSAFDPEGEQLTYLLITNVDSNSFEFSETGVLKLKDELNADFETQSSYTLTARVSDGQNDVESTFVVSVQNRNEFPSLESPILENVIEDSLIDISGRLIASDPDGPEGLSFLVNGTVEASDIFTAAGSYGILRLDKLTGVYSYELDNANATVNSLTAGEKLLDSFDISVSDGELISASKTLAFQILGQNDAPVISVLRLILNENEFGAASARLGFKDPEGSSLDRFILPTDDFEKFEITPEGVLKLKDTVAANFETKSSYKVTVRASDGVNVTDKVIEVSVEDVNEAPTLTKPVDLNIIENSGATVLGQFEVNDPEGSEDLKFIVSGSTENGSNLEVIGSYGTLTIDQGTRNYSYSLDDNNVLVDALSTNDTLTEIFQISVSDGTSLSNVQELAVTIAGVNDEMTNLRLSKSSLSEYEFGATVGQILVSDPENADLTYTLATSGDNDFFEITQAGMLKLKDVNKAEFNDRPSYSIFLTVSDDVHNISGQFEIAVLDINLAPALAIKTLNQTANEDSIFTLTLPDKMFTDGDDETLTISSSLIGGETLPTWLNFDADTKVFSGTPMNDHVGVLNISIQAEDRFGLTAEDQFALTISNTNDAPTFIKDPVLTIFEDNIYAYDIEVDDVDVLDSVSVIVDTKPSWLSFDMNSRLLSGIPTNSAVGDHKVVLRAVDSLSAETIQEFSISVINVNDVPTLNNPIPDLNFQEGDYDLFTFEENVFEDVDIGDNFVYEASLSTGGELPSWITFNPQNRTLSGIPGQNDVGSIDIILTATDTGGASITDEFSISVSYLNDAPTALSLTKKLQLPENNGSFVFDAVQNLLSDPDLKYGDTLSYSATLLEGAALPNWIMINKLTGSLNGTSPQILIKQDPSTQKLSAYDAEANTYNADGSLQYETSYLLVTATDSGGLSKSIEIELSPSAPIEIYENTISITDYPYNQDPVDSALSATVTYREGIGNILKLDNFSVEDSNIKLVTDLHDGSWNLHTWPTSPEIKLNLSNVSEGIENFNLGIISINIAEIKNDNGTNVSTIEEDEKYLNVKFTANITSREDGGLEFNYNPIIEMDLKSSANQTPLTTSSTSAINETLGYSQGRNGAPDQLSIKFLDLLDELPFSSEIATKFPFENGDYYLSIDGLPLQASDGTFLDLIETQFTII